MVPGGRPTAAIHGDIIPSYSTTSQFSVGPCIHPNSCRTKSSHCVHHTWERGVQTTDYNPPVDARYIIADIFIKCRALQKSNMCSKTRRKESTDVKSNAKI